MPGRYATYGWTAYTGLIQVPAADDFASLNVLSSAALGALVVSLLATSSTAIGARRWLLRIAITAATLVGAMLISVGAHRGHGLPTTLIFNPLVAFGVVVSGIAIREVTVRTVSAMANHSSPTRFE